MKGSDLSYGEWKCITKKEINRKFVKTDNFDGYVEVGLLKNIDMFKQFTYELGGRG